MKILITGDWHLDQPKIGRINPDTDLDLRTEDVFAAVDYMIDYAINNKIDLFVLNGDLFKGRTSTHHIETLFAERCFKIASHMRFIINLGNHDYTPKQLSYGIHTYSILQRFDLPNTEILTEISHKSFDNVDIVFYPYYDLKRVQSTNNEELLQWIGSTVNGFELTKDCKLFIGHGTPEGTAIHGSWSFDLDLIDEPVLPQKFFESFDMALFSHIHRCHAITPKIFHIGSPERIDFSEVEDDKGFSIYDTNTKQMQWVSTNPRPMAVFEIDLLKIDEFDDPTDLIIKEFINIPNLDQCMLKISVECSDKTLSLIEHPRLQEALGKAFYVQQPISYSTPKLQKSRLKEVTEQISEIEALERVVRDRKDFSDTDKEQILLRGRAILGSLNDI